MIINIKREVGQESGDQDQDMVGNPRAVTYVSSEACSKAATARAKDR